MNMLLFMILLPAAVLAAHHTDTLFAQSEGALSPNVTYAVYLRSARVGTAASLVSEVFVVARDRAASYVAVAVLGRDGRLLREWRQARGDQPGAIEVRMRDFDPLNATVSAACALRVCTDHPPGCRVAPVFCSSMF